MAEVALNLGAIPDLIFGQVRLPLPGAGASLLQEEHQRLATLFLSHKALLLTIVATATSRLPGARGKSAQASAVNDGLLKKQARDDAEIGARLYLASPACARARIPE